MPTSSNLSKLPHSAASKPQTLSLTFTLTHALNSVILGGCHIAADQMTHAPSVNPNPR